MLENRTREILPLGGTLASAFPNLNCTLHLYNCLCGIAALWPRISV